MAGMKVKIDNKMNRLAARITSNQTNTLAAAAALLQREIMAQAITMSIWDTGNLINSHNRRKVGRDSWEVYSPAEYSVFIHEGTDWNIFTRGPMPARPWVEQGIERAKRPVFDMLRRAVQA